MTLEEARALAQKAGKAITIAKAKPWGNAVVLRDWKPWDETSWYFIEKVEADPCK